MIRRESQPIDYEVLWGQLAARVRELAADVEAHFRTTTPDRLGYYQGAAVAYSELQAAMVALRDAASGFPKTP